ncbi:MAG: glycosyltransferase N-terminal domain-containing protein [Flavobacteriaceae bacterium]|jgi:3-deoxy-D-manno-octulosonic-acid transferase|nr:glycosyltransferase N-terminal domain-containing protein [Flavobacteriaceae bacterium]
MPFLYSLAVSVAKAMTPVVAKSTKTKAFVAGRKALWTQLKGIPQNKKVVWMHCASLGEYEQGLPVLTALKNNHPEYFYLVTFFSPSGYEVRKNHGIADLVTYLPWDTKADVKRFVALVNPVMALLVKYEFWPNLIRELQRKEVPLYLISGLFRQNQRFFKPWGNSQRKLLREFAHLFVQNEASLKLLQSIGVQQVSVSGDTRFDRVGAAKEPLAFMDTFVGARKCIVAGSTWPEDEALLLEAIRQTPKDWCWLIAPHEMHEAKLNHLMAQLPKGSLRYTQNEEATFDGCPVLVLDTVGMLGRSYPYASLAYVGGGMGTSGLHNILEPAAEGVPIVIGKNYDTFPEAKDLIDLGGVISVATADACSKQLSILQENDALREEKGSTNKNYVRTNQGATAKTLSLLNQRL